MNTVTFHEPMMLTWPAIHYWYPFLGAVHESLGRHARLTYDDKDIMVPSNFIWSPDGDYYTRLQGFDAALMRFNERGQRGYETAERPQYRITLRWHGYNQVSGFDYQRIES